MPLKDRLPDFQASQKRKDTPRTAEVNIPLARRDSTEKFLEKVERIADTLDLLTSKVDALKRIHEAIFGTAYADQSDQVELDRLLKELMHISSNVRTSMKALLADVEGAMKRTKNPLAYRIQRTQYSALSRRLMNIMADYNREQLDYRNKLKARMKRQLQITDFEGKPTSDADIEALLETKSAMVFSQGIVADSERVKEALADVEARHRDILALEKNVMEVAQLFNDIAILVEHQSETVDRVENNTDGAINAVMGGKTELAGARASQKRTRKCTIILLVIGVVTIFVIAIVLAVQLK